MATVLSRQPDQFVILRHQVQDHPATVLGYACKNHYDDIANQAAPLTLDIDLKTVSNFLGPTHMLQWVGKIPLMGDFYIVVLMEFLSGR